MSTAIRFDQIQIEDGQRISVTCTIQSDGRRESHDLWFDLSEPVAIEPRNLALALSTLCGKVYDRVHFDLDLDLETATNIGKFTNAEVTSRKITSVQSKNRQDLAGHILSFSGGFDSLAARALMPPDTRLVSLDFGGRFRREREFFENFQTLRVSTNIVQTPFRSNSWLFMATGAILANASFSAGFHTFGTILEASPDGMSVKPHLLRRPYEMPLRDAGMLSAPYVAGLTEIGTLLVMAEFYPEFIEPSLASLASPGEEKLFRKSVLANVVGDRLGKELHRLDIAAPMRPHFKFGEVFALDFLIFYVAKFADRSTVERMLRDVPDVVYSLARSLDLTFYERVNSTLFSTLPIELRAGAFEKLTRAGVHFYTEQDWIEFARVRNVLNRYHNGISAV